MPSSVPGASALWITPLLPSYVDALKALALTRLRWENREGNTIDILTVFQKPT
jgi:hypothetical protein